MGEVYVGEFKKMVFKNIYVFFKLRVPIIEDGIVYDVEDHEGHAA